MSASLRSSTDPAGRPLPVLSAGHVGLSVTDLDRSIDFYVGGLGLQLLDRGADGGRSWAFLGEDGRAILTLWAGSSPTAPGLHHLAFAAPGLEQVREIEEHLEDLGARFAYDGVVPHADGSPAGGVFLLDPDGLRLEVFTDQGLPEDAVAPVPGVPTCGFF